VITTVENFIDSDEGIFDLIQSKKLTFDECCAITYYSCDVRNFYPSFGKLEDCPFRVLNYAMVKRDAEMLNHWTAFIFFLVSGLNKLDNTEAVVYRAIDKPLSQLSNRYKLGSKICWVSFTSTSLDMNIMKNFMNKSKTEGTFMQINVTEGKNISEFSLFPDEKELLLLPNSYFSVNEVISNNMKKLLSLPLSIDGIILSQISTPNHLILLKQTSFQNRDEIGNRQLYEVQIEKKGNEEIEEIEIKRNGEKKS